jgi:ubiquinone/menaquinone biosynthesis C-methylase UbiE
MTTSYTHDSPQLAATYDRISDSQFAGGKRLVERMNIREGERVLDVGCGTGRLGRWLAEVVGPSGSVVGVDPLPERIAIARTHAPGVEFEVGQAEDLSAFADADFDAVCMSAVFHWVTDKPKALAEVRRVLRPGGRLGVTTVPRELNGAGTVAAVVASILQEDRFARSVDFSKLAVVSRGHTTTDVIGLVLGSQLDLTELQVMPRLSHHASGSDAVDYLEASSFGNFLRIVPEDLRPALRDALAAGFEARRGPSGIPARDYGMVFVATRP